VTGVITYGNDGVQQIAITPGQERMLVAAGVWPHDDRGRELCQVSHGLHDGEPTHTDDQLRARCGLA
jgi:hypothetical protein